MVNFGDFLKTSKCDFFVIFNHCVKVKVRLVLASRELSGVLIDIVTLKAQLHKTSIFLDIDDSIQNEKIGIQFWRQNTHIFFFQIV